jgi:L-cysteine S-thiosulfotransferase
MRLAVLAAAGLLLGTAAAQPAPRADGLAAPLTATLTGILGDAARGRAIVANRQLGLCLLCHQGPFPEEPFQGNLAPPLDGAGTRLSVAQLRLRMVDSRRVNPASIMPAYGRSDGFTRVAAAFRGRPILDDQAIEDVVAFLATLR